MMLRSFDQLENAIAMIRNSFSWVSVGRDDAHSHLVKVVRVPYWVQYRAEPVLMTVLMMRGDFFVARRERGLLFILMGFRAVSAQAARALRSPSFHRRNSRVCAPAHQIQNFANTTFIASFIIRH